MLILLFLIRFGYAEKSVLIIGGDDKNGGDTAMTVEQFFPSNMTTRIIGIIEVLSHAKSYVQVTPVNASHAFLLPWQNSLKTLKRNSYYIDTEAKLTTGPVVDPIEGPGLTSIPGDNGQMIPIYCGGEKRRRPLKYCRVILSRQEYFEPMLEEQADPSLIAFGNTLIAIGRSSYYDAKNTTVQRYSGTEWISCKHAPIQCYYCTAVKLNETALLICGAGDYSDGDMHKRCYVYHVNKDEWTPAPEMKGSGYEAEMVLIGQTVYAFGGSDGGRSNVQTLDISGGILKEQWKLEPLKMKRNRKDFGVWVIDPAPRTTTGYTLSMIFLILFLSIVVYFVHGVLYRRFVVGARGIQQLPHHSFWLKLFRGTRHLCATKFACSRRFISVSTENQNYSRTVAITMTIAYNNNVTPTASATTEQLAEGETVNRE